MFEKILSKLENASSRSFPYAQNDNIVSVPNPGSSAEHSKYLSDTDRAVEIESCKIGFKVSPTTPSSAVNVGSVPVKFSIISLQSDAARAWSELKYGSRCN